jgi:hypothetical protein
MVLALAGCEKPAPPPPPDFAPSSILDDAPPPAPAPAPAAEAPAPAEPPAATADDEPELVRERQSRSTLGRTRDMARDVRDDLSGGTSAPNGLAETDGLPQVVRVEGLAFAVPDPWRIAIPSNPMRKAEILIQSRLGNATITFTTAGGTARDNVQRWERQVLDSVGDPVSARTETAEGDGGRVTTIAAMEGTYLDGPPGGAQQERPFWALRGAIIERPGMPTVFVKMFGPEDTVTQAEELFKQMVLSAE